VSKSGGIMADNEDAKLKLKLRAFQTAEGWVKQLIWLSTGTIALSATLLTGWANASSFEGIGFLIASWAVLGLSLVLGLYVVGALARELNRKTPETLNIYERNITGPAICQEVVFGVGIILFSIFAVVNLI